MITSLYLQVHESNYHCKSGNYYLMIANYENSGLIEFRVDQESNTRFIVVHVTLFCENVVL